MSEQPAQAEMPVFSIEKIYLKDLSLEIPGAPQVFSERESPKIDVNIHNAGRPLNPGLFEVVLTATITAKHGDRTAFLVEVKQAGVFQIRNIPDADMDPVLAIACPNILFPYVRETVSSVISRAGFPPFLLNHLSFEMLYQQHLQQRQQGESSPAQEPSGSVAPPPAH